ncbi:MAG: dethiobiotin synthase [Clostridia bacterium]|nr:dethiobiotin synthase [Deltaproteobacteria bacterium]
MSYFVTGTDTGVGKTVVATMLAHGLGAHYWKPIQTGATESTDSDFARRWLGHARVVPESFVFAAPLSPNLAAASEGRVIDVRDCERAFARTPRPIVVEGAGGVLVPLARGVLLVDLMAQLALPVIVVARTSLGTINHTLLTLECLSRRGLAVRGVILNGEPQSNVARTIAEYAPFIGKIQPCATFDSDWFNLAYKDLDLP